MKITFRGWNRQVMVHEHSVKPVPGTYVRHPVGKAGSPIQWSSALQANGKIDDLHLGGDFHVQFDFGAAELRNWLTKYAAEEPEAAIRLLAEMQAEATIALAKPATDVDEE